MLFKQAIKARPVSQLFFNSLKIYKHILLFRKKIFLFNICVVKIIPIHIKKAHKRCRIGDSWIKLYVPNQLNHILVGYNIYFLIIKGRLLSKTLLIKSIGFISISSQWRCTFLAIWKKNKNYSNNKDQSDKDKMM